MAFTRMNISDIFSTFSLISFIESLLIGDSASLFGSCSVSTAGSVPVVAPWLKVHGNLCASAIECQRLDSIRTSIAPNSDARMDGAKSNLPLQASTVMARPDFVRIEKLTISGVEGRTLRLFRFLLPPDFRRRHRQAVGDARGESPGCLSPIHFENRNACTSVKTAA